MDLSLLITLPGNIVVSTVKLVHLAVPPLAALFFPRDTVLYSTYFSFYHKNSRGTRRLSPVIVVPVEVKALQIDARSVATRCVNR